tara:strand:+ start:90 stop:221 length:132 start_codon:yes stop_codon:yes gene_type:complete
VIRIVTQLPRPLVLHFTGYEVTIVEEGVEDDVDVQDDEGEIKQ